MYSVRTTEYIWRSHTKEKLVRYTTRSKGVLSFMLNSALSADRHPQKS